MLEELRKLKNMNQLKSVSEIGENLTVILRLDLDLPIENDVVLDNSRLLKSLPTIKLLLEKNNKIIIIGHRGRPQSRDINLSLKVVYVELLGLLENNLLNSVFIDDIKDVNKIKTGLENCQIIFIENLRFWKEEEENDPLLFENLKYLSDAFVNDAFAVAHRKSASVMLQQWMETYYGLSFCEEAEKIGKLVENPEKPVTIVLGGAKEDKLKYLPELEKIADYILVGGKLPKLIKESVGEKVKIAKLREDGLDLNDEDIRKFKEIILQSGTVVWAGAMGMYEDNNCQKGTTEIALAVAESKGYKVIAGGDTAASIKNLGLENKIDFICSGGGVMLEYLVKGTLPAWE